MKVQTSEVLPLESTLALKKSNPVEKTGLDQVARLWCNKNAIDTPLQVGHDVAECIANNGAQQQKNGNHHNGYQNKNQRIFNQALPLFVAKLQH